MKTNSFLINRNLIVVLWILRCACFISQPLRAQPNASFNFVRQIKTAEGVGSGHNQVSKHGTLTTLIYNPAILGDTSISNQLVVSYEKFLLDINGALLAYARHFQEIGTFSISIFYINYGQFEGRDQFGVSTGLFGANELSFQVSYGRRLWGSEQLTLDVGASAKYLFSQIENYYSSALAFDVGLLLNFLKQGIQVGISSLNLGAQLYSYSGIIETLPYDLRIGASFKLLEAPVVFNVGLIRLLDPFPLFWERFVNFAAGIEVTIEHYIIARLGYNNRDRLNVLFSGSEVFHLGGFSFGAGGRFLNYALDYGLISLGTIGWQHQITLKYAF